MLSVQRDVTRCIDEEGAVVDGASEELGRARGTLRALTSQIRSMLKGYGGEVSEQGGRLCVATLSGGRLWGVAGPWGQGWAWPTGPPATYRRVSWQKQNNTSLIIPHNSTIIPFIMIIHS